MNLNSTISVYGGGPGSGCTGPNCGRPEETHQLTELLKKHPFPAWADLLRNGHAGVVAPFTKEEKVELKELMHSVPKCKIGFCYMNSQRIAMAGLFNDKVKLIEGLTTVHGVPISHSWIEYNGKVYDPTVLKSNGKPKTGAPVGEYFGVEIPKKWIAQHQLNTRRYSPLTGHDSKFREKILK